MDVATDPLQACAWCATGRRAGNTIGFVPTMGALHTGHMGLIAQAMEQCDRVAVSIFVNPLQFNDPKDLEAYPRQLDADRALLADAGCHLLFTPDAIGLFGDLPPREFDMAGIDAHWEGPIRPGHFQGMLNAVDRLFHFIRPDMAFFGEKDRQQLMLVQHVAKTLRWPERIVGVPTVREPDGLAMSSRNARLTPDERKRATLLYHALKAMANNAFHAPVERCTDAGNALLATDPLIHVEYLGIGGPDRLFPISDWDGVDHAYALVAARVGEVRLIDNLPLHR